MGTHLEEPTQVYNRDCPILTIKHGGGSVMKRVTMSFFCAVPIPTLKERFTEEKNAEILVAQVYSMKQTLFPTGDGILQDDNAPIHATGLIHS
ncbi:DDE_3 domain-containing protein [Trichonephila clavipes]|nr:DDE_3 domain-containing protein [Trichonephila clavipes]